MTAVLLLPHDEAGVVLVDVELAVEPEVLGIRAEEALDVRLRGQDVELLVLEGAQILPSNLRSLFELGKVEALAQTRLAEAVTDFEHGGKPILGAPARMLVDHHEAVETDGKSGRDGHAEGERSDHDRNRGDPGSTLPQLEPLEIPLRAARHHQGDQSEQEGQRDCVARLPRGRSAWSGASPRSQPEASRGRRGRRPAPSRPCVYCLT